MNSFARRPYARHHRDGRRPSCMPSLTSGRVVKLRQAALFTMLLSWVMLLTCCGTRSREEGWERGPMPKWRHSVALSPESLRNPAIYPSATPRLFYTVGHTAAAQTAPPLGGIPYSPSSGGLNTLAYEQLLTALLPECPESPLREASPDSISMLKSKNQSLDLRSHHTSRINAYYITRNRSPPPSYPSKPRPNFNITGRDTIAQEPFTRSSIATMCMHGRPFTWNARSPSPIGHASNRSVVSLPQPNHWLSWFNQG